LLARHDDDLPGWTTRILFLCDGTPGQVVAAGLAHRGQRQPRSSGDPVRLKAVPIAAIAGDDRDCLLTALS